MIAQHIILEKIKQYINEYDSIYVLANKCYTYVSLFRNISSLTAKKYLLLVAGLEKECIPMSGVDIYRISNEEYHVIERIYYLYEFSGHIHLVDDHAQCGSLNNYVVNGLLTEDEVAIALLK